MDHIAAEVVHIDCFVAGVGHIDHFAVVANMHYWSVVAGVHKRCFEEANMCCLAVMEGHIDYFVVGAHKHCSVGVNMRYFAVEVDRTDYCAAGVDHIDDFAVVASTHCCSDAVEAHRHLCRSVGVSTCCLVALVDRMVYFAVANKHCSSAGVDRMRYFVVGHKHCSAVVEDKHFVLAGSNILHWVVVANSMHCSVGLSIRPVSINNVH